MTAPVPARALPLSEWPAYRLAVWAFLLSEGFLFASVLAAGVFLRLGGTVPWPRPGEALGLGPAVFATVVLICSSATLNESLDSLRRGNPGITRRWLVWTFVAGSFFLGMQALEWRDLINTAKALSTVPGVPLASNPWGAATFLQFFFLATGLHGLHVVGGLILMAWLLVSGAEIQETRLECVALYWHFVDLVWVFVLSTLYFL